MRSLGRLPAEQRFHVATIAVSIAAVAGVFATLPDDGYSGHTATFMITMTTAMFAAGVKSALALVRAYRAGRSSGSGGTGEFAQPVGDRFQGRALGTQKEVGRRLIGPLSNIGE